MTPDILRDFALDSEALSVLASFQARLVDEDIKQTKNTNRIFKDNSQDLRDRKSAWARRWRKTVRDGFDALDTDPKPQIWDGNPPGLTHLRMAADRLPAGLVLLELAAFDAYWPMARDQKDECKGLALQPAVYKEALTQASVELGFPSTRGAELREQLQSTQKSIGGVYTKMIVSTLAGLGLSALTFGMAAPFIAGLIGAAMGLSGAAAVSAGLAALGGGAAAAGGFGMAGGMVVLVGGGAILGVGAGAGTGGILAQMTSESALLSSAKLEVVLKEFVLQGQRDMAKIQAILGAQRRTIHTLEEECDRLRLAGKEHEKRIQELENAIGVLRDALKRNQGFSIS